MNSSQHRCMNQAPASENQTQQRSLNSSLKTLLVAPWFIWVVKWGEEVGLLKCVNLYVQKTHRDIQSNQAGTDDQGGRKIRDLKEIALWGRRSNSRISRDMT
ncbi:hypothetical protein TNCV_1394151 [Trichonephila clavipes]|nr:hypothetical protein TNCV_1394151 [Trichonephila clavipes]